MPASSLRKLFGLAIFCGVFVIACSWADRASANSTPEPQAKSKAKSKPKGEAAAKTLQFEIYLDKAAEYRWRLKATNSQVIATSGQGYKDKRDCQSAIDRIKADAKSKLKFETYTDASDDTRWRLKATNGQIIATSGQGYKDKRDCEHAIDVIKTGAADAKVEEAQ
jgi:uncharacterized protein YegP (UPF0339 family)